MPESAFRVTRKVSPTVLPVTPMEVKLFLGINNDNEDELLKSFILISMEYAQWYMEKSLTKQTWLLSCFTENCPEFIYLPFSPLIDVLSVEVSVGSSPSHSLSNDNYFVDKKQSRIVFLKTLLTASKIDITYESGYADAQAIPMQVKYGILHHIALIYKYRESISIRHLDFIKEMYLPFREVRLVF